MPTVASSPPCTLTGRALHDANAQFYDRLWSETRLVTPERFNTWPLIHPLIAGAPDRLEIAPGLRPRLPIAGTHFLDISEPAMVQLATRGGRTTVSSASSIPYPDASFDLIAVLDVLEHLEDDDAVLAEAARVARPGAVLLLATPLHADRWTAFDDFVGHARRYEPGELVKLLASHGFIIERSAVYGMQPKNSSRLLDWGIWWLTHHRARAIWWYNRVIMPLAMRFQKKLVLHDGLIDLQNVDEVLLVCRKAEG